MLSFRLCEQDLGNPWAWQGNRWVTGTSWIEPFTNPVLEHALARDEAGRVLVLVRERCGSVAELPVPMPGVFGVRNCERLRDAVMTARGEFLLLEISPGRRVRLTAGPYGTAPLYLGASRSRNGNLLEGSWDAAVMGRRLRSGSLLDRAVARMLTRRWRSGTDTLWQDVHRLVERTVATWDGETLLLDAPEDALHVLQPRRLRAGADPVAGLAVLLDAVVRRLPVQHEATAVELSGGVDSANVALTLARAGVNRSSNGLRAYGVLLNGDMGKEQRRRRRALVTAVGLSDVTVHAADHLPLVADGPRSLPHDPAGEMYPECFEPLRARLADEGVRVVYTGFGGDETMSLRPAERARQPPPDRVPPWLGFRALAALGDVDVNVAPVSPVPVPTLLANTARSQGFMRHGIWPVSPLADPEVARFGASLPTEWRRRKRVLRDRLRLAGLPEYVADPEIPEVFTGHMQEGLRHHGLPLTTAMLSDSLLADLGHVDRAGLARFLSAVPPDGEIDDLLYDTLALEIGLRTLTGAPALVASGLPSSRRPEVSRG